MGAATMAELRAGARPVEVTSHGEPSPAAWDRFATLAAAALVRLAERNAIADASERAA